MATRIIDETKLKVKLQLKDPFLGSIAMQVKWVKRDMKYVACTNGVTLFYNEDLLNKYALDMQVGIIAHECLHIALQHSSRAKNIEAKNKMLYNIAADIVVNNELLENRFILPEDAIVYTYFKGFTTEQVYYYLYSDSPNMSMPEELQDIEDADKNDQKKIKDILINSSVSKGFSRICSEYEREFNKLINPKLPWNIILKNYVNDVIQDDYSWKKPNRRYEDIILPSVCSETDILTSLYVYIDVSGSIDDDVLNNFISELRKLHNDLPIQHIRIQFFSTGLFSTTDIYTEWINPRICTSGGGTDIDVVLTDIRKCRPAVSVIFTDGLFGVDELIISNRTPIVWVIRNNKEFKVNRGKIIEIEDN